MRSSDLLGLLILPAPKVSSILQVLPKLEIPHSQHVKGSNHALIRPPDTASTFQDCHIPCRCCRKGRSRTRDTSRVVIMRSLDVLVCRFGTTS